MKILYIIITMMLFNFNYVYPFQTSLQELEKKLISAKGTERINLLNQVSSILKEEDPEQAIHYSNEAISLSKKFIYPEGEAKARNNLGVSNAVLGNNKEAENQFRISLKIFTQMNDNYGIAISNNNLGRVLTKTGNFKEALVNLLQSYKISKQYEFLEMTYNSSYHLGSLYDKLNDLSQTLKYYFISFDIAKKFKNQDLIISSLNAIGDTYYNISNYPKALQYFKDALNYCKESDLSNKEMLFNNIGNIYFATNKFENAEEYYLMSFDIITQMNDTLGMGISYLNLANVFYKNNEKIKAKEYYLKSIEIFKNADAILDLADAYQYYGTFLNEIHESTEAKNKLESSLILYEKLGLIKGQKEVQSQLLTLYIKKYNRSKAINTFEKLSTLIDSIQVKDKNETVNSIIAKNDAVNQMKDIKILLAQEKTKFNLLMTIILSVLVLLAIIIISYIVAKKQAQKIKEKKEQLSFLEFSLQNFHGSIVTDVKSDWYLLANIILNSKDSSNYNNLCSTFNQVSHKLSDILDKYQPQIHFNNN